MDAEAMDADDDETTRRAIAVLTAWAATPDSTQFSQDVVSSYATDADELHELLTGMTTVAGWLLLHHARLTHRSTSQVLQHLAQSFT